MTTVDDYILVVAQGQLQKSSGLLGRRRAHDTLPDLPHGYERVLRGKDGSLSAMGTGLTAGERYWSTSATWFHVDVRTHDLTYQFSQSSQDGRSEYVVTVKVSVRITSPVDVIRLNLHSVRPYVVPVLAARVDAALDDGDDVPAGVDDAMSLIEAHAGVGRAVKRQLQAGTLLDIDGWLECRIVSVRTDLDADTKRHLDELREARRAAEMVAARMKTKQVEATEEIKLRGQWANHLDARLGDALTRAVEVAASNPTAENIDRIVQRLDTTDRDARGEFVAVLRSLIDKELVVDASDVSAFQAILKELQGGASGARSEPTPGRIVVESDRVGEIKPVDADQGAETEESDKSWSG